MNLMVNNLLGINSQAKNRFLFMDLWRILAIVNMLIYQICYTIYILQGQDPSWLVNPWVQLWQKYIVASFIILSGMALSLGKNNLVRAGRFIVLGIFISVLSYFFAPQQPHYYGILMFLGIAIAALTPVLWWFKKAPASCGLILSGIGYELTRHLSNQVIMWQGKIIANLPDWLYGSWNAWLGMPPKDFISINYVPVLPNIFLFLVGFYLLRFLQEHQAGQKYLKISNNKSLAYLSSSSLLIYLLQQPLIFLGLEIKKFL